MSLSGIIAFEGYVRQQIIEVFVLFYIIYILIAYHTLYFHFVCSLPS